MDFIMDLELTDISKKNIFDKEGNRTFRIFKGINLKNDIRLSIQASYAHYCIPRKTLPRLLDYTHFELALMSGEGEFLSADEALPDFPALEELKGYFEGQVFCYVPADLVNEVYLALK